MKAIFLLLALLYCTSGQAQRRLNTEPSFGLQKIKALINSARDSKLKEMHSSKGDTSDILFIFPTPLSEEVYSTLSLREKFTYNMISPESYWQNCTFTFSSWSDNQIPAQLPLVSNMYNWSARQIKFFQANKDSIIEFIRLDGQPGRHLGLNDKTVIVYVNATAMIPLLQKCYRTTKDCQILTALMLLMKDNQYAPFMQSDLFKQLYVGSLHQMYRNATDRNKDNEAFILGQATNFYNELSK
jgi:hypothetical protein